MLQPHSTHPRTEQIRYRLSFKLPNYPFTYQL